MGIISLLDYSDAGYPVQILVAGEVF